MLGFAQATTVWPEPFVPVARRVADWWTAHAPADHVAYWDFDAPAGPGTPRDTSGTAIAAASLLKLAALIPDRAERYREAAEVTLHALVNGYLTPTTPDDHRPPGILTGGCYNHRIGLATSNELIWGDYFLLEALLALGEHLDPTAI